MKRIITETPEKWVILKLSEGYYKVFGSWSGGYLGNNRWKLNSGIEKVEQDDDFYYFIGFSGSCYKCHKKSYGIRDIFGVAILNTLLERGNGQLELMKNVKDWSKEITLN